MKFRLEKIALKLIKVVGKHRPLIKKKLAVIANSMDAIGLRTPITVRKAMAAYGLVAGQHRLEAAKSLGWTDIDCIVMTGKKLDRQLWREAENLHRAGLTVLQRAKAMQRWERLLEQREAGEDGAPKGGRQPSDKGLSKTAKQLGTSRETVRRSRAVASLSPKAQKTAKALGLDDNEAALLRVAKEPTPKAQTKKVHELAKKPRKRSSSLDAKEVKQLKALKRAFAPSPEFIELWNESSVGVHQSFVKSVLGPTSRLHDDPTQDDEW
jgi:ParB family transcriptional regulator, chromosome partitioning protein